MLALVVCAQQRRVDPRDTNHRAICVVALPSTILISRRLPSELLLLGNNSVLTNFRFRIASRRELL